MKKLAGKSAKKAKPSAVRKVLRHIPWSYTAAFSIGAAVGVIAGIMLAPAKNGISCNSGNTTNNYYTLGEDAIEAAKLTEEETPAE